MKTLRKSKIRTNHEKKILWIIIGIIVAVVALIYIGISFYFKNHFFPRTVYDSVSVGYMTLSEAQEVVDEMLDEYTLIVKDRDGNSYTVSATDCGLETVDDSLLEETLKEQNAFAWFLYLLTGQEVTQEVTVDETAVTETVTSLALFTSDSIQAPEDATITWSEDDNAFVVTDAVEGNTLIEDSVVEKVVEGLTSLATSVELTDDDYESPTIYADDDTVVTACETANSYLSASITYDIYSNVEVVDADEIAEWISIDDDYNVTLDEDAIYDYVQTLATKYNTYGDERQFTTTLGDTITIGGGDYGWVIDKSGEVEQIVQDIESGEAVSREPVYEQEAYTDGTDDIGDTYVEIDYTNQRLYYYVDGVLTLQTDIVSGNISNGNGSPDGVFKIVYKQRDATLVGEDYESEVSYFMPFAYNVGIHDASWRSSFGGSIYKTSGSHGCINVPESIAEQLYSLIEVGTPVVAYYRESVELTSENAATSNAYSYVDEDADE